ncbi:MAG: hypothetical protein NTU94_07825 [Planctomycetota bacterium]|nr:hypothetical protein [Planctomycetota bacterium]
MEKLRRPGPRGERFRTINNGKLIFTYREAWKGFGLTRRIFLHALDQLIARGFIDVAKTGGGMLGDCSLYGLSERWRVFGTAEFKECPRPKGRKWETETAHRKVRAPVHKKVRACPPTAHINVRGLPEKPAPDRAQKGAYSNDYQALSENEGEGAPARPGLPDPDVRLLHLAGKNRGRPLTDKERASFLEAVLKARAVGATEPLIAYYVLGAAPGAAPWIGPDDASAAAKRLLGSFQNAVDLPEERTAVEQLLVDMAHADRYLATWTVADGNQGRDHNQRVLDWAKVYAEDLAAAAAWPATGGGA